MQCLPSSQQLKCFNIQVKVFHLIKETFYFVETESWKWEKNHLKCMSRHFITPQSSQKIAKHKKLLRPRKKNWDKEQGHMGLAGGYERVHEGVTRPRRGWEKNWAKFDERGKGGRGSCNAVAFENNKRLNWKVQLCLQLHFS